MREINPNIMALVEAEREFTERLAGPKVRRVKIEKPGHAWLVRFLPVALGKSASPFVRHGQHWLNKKPFVCPRAVSPDFGGNPDTDCPVCELSDALNREPDEGLSTAGYKLRANATHITFCLVFQIDMGRGEVTEMPMAEQLNPWEFSMYTSTFDELMDYFRRGRSSARPLSILDPKKGNDFWATRTKKGIRLDRQDEGPIFKLNANFEKYLDQVLNAVHEPRIQIPTAQQLKVFARKARADAYGEDDDVDDDRDARGGRGDRDDGDARGGRGGRTLGRVLEEDETSGEEGEEAEETSRPGRSGGRAVGRGLPRHEADDDVPEGEEAPPARSGRTASRSVERPAAEEPEEAAEAPVDEDASSDAAPEDADSQEDQVPGAEMPARKPASRPSGRATAVPVSRASSAGRVPPPAVRRVAAAGSETRETVSDEEDTGVAEERHDYSAPAENPLPADDAQEERPRVVARDVSGGTAAMQSRLAERIRRVQSPPNR